MTRALAIAIGLCLLLSCSGFAQRPLWVDVGANLGMIESSVGRFYTVNGFIQSGQPDGVQFRLGGVISVGDASTMTQIESLALYNFRFGSRIYLGAGIGVVGVTGGPASGTGVPIIALAGLKTPPMENFKLTVEGAFYYGFLPEAIAFRWGVGGTFSF